MRTLSQIISLYKVIIAFAVINFTALGPNWAQAEVHLKDSSKKIIALLNSRRTQATLLFYAPVIAEMVNNSHLETQSTFRKAFRFVTRTSLEKDQAEVEHIKTCAAQLITEWQNLILSGKNASTEGLITELLQKPARNCSAIWSGFIDYKVAQFAHWAYLHGLVKAELNFSVPIQKTEQLKALNHLISRGGDHYFQAAESIALFFMEDQDEDIAEQARTIVRGIPGWTSTREKLDWVRPDFLQAGGFIRPALTTLIASLTSLSGGALTTGQTVGLVSSLGLHATGASIALSEKKPESKFKIEGLESLIRQYQQFNFIDSWIPIIKFDPLDKDLIKQFAENSVRKSEDLNQNANQLGSFVISLETHKFNKIELLMAEQMMAQLSEVSKAIGKALQYKSQRFEQNIDSARHIAFSRTKISRYKKNQTQLIPLIMGEGGNCQANTLLMLSLFFPQRQYLPADWKLAVEVMPGHIQPVLWNKKTNFRVDLVSGNMAQIERNSLFAPEIYFKGALKLAETDWSNYLLNKPSDVNFLNKTSYLKKTLSSNPVFNLPIAAYEAPEPFVPDEATIDFTPIVASLKENDSITRSGPQMSEDQVKKAREQYCLPPHYLVNSRIYSNVQKSSYQDYQNPYLPFTVNFYSCKMNHSESFDYTTYLLNEDDQHIVQKIPGSEPNFNALQKLSAKQINTAISIQNAIFDILTEPEKQVDLKSLADQLRFSKSMYIGFNEILNLGLNPSTVIEAIFSLHKIKIKTADFAHFSEINLNTLDIWAQSPAFDESHRVLFSNVEFRKYFENLYKLIKSVHSNLDAVIELIDSSKTAEQNKLILLELLDVVVQNYGIIGLPHNSGPPRHNSLKFIKKYPLLQLSLAGYRLSENYLDLVTNRRRLAILEKGQVKKTTAPKIQIFENGGVGALNIVEVKSKASDKKENEICSSTKAANCKARMLWLNLEPAQTYVSAETFLKLYFQILNNTFEVKLLRSQSSPRQPERYLSGLASKLAQRWDEQLGNLMISISAILFKPIYQMPLQGWTDKQPFVKMYSTHSFSALAHFWLINNQDKIKELRTNPKTSKKYENVGAMSSLFLPPYLDKIQSCGYSLPDWEYPANNLDYELPETEFKNFSQEKNNSFERVRKCFASSSKI